VEHESNPNEQFEDEEKAAILKMLKVCEKNYGEEVSMRFQRVLKAIEKIKPEFEFGTPSELFTEIENNENNLNTSPATRPDESRFGRMRRNLVKHLSSIASLNQQQPSTSSTPLSSRRENSNTTLKDSTSTEMMTMVRTPDGDVIVIEGKAPDITPSPTSSAPNAALEETQSEGGDIAQEARRVRIQAPSDPQLPHPQLVKELSDSKMLKDKIYTLNVLALQAEEFIQWLYHQFGESIPGLDEISMRNKIQMIRMIPHHIAVSKNLLVLEEMVLQLLDHFKKPNLVTQNRSLSIALSL